jgi:phospholipid/cholesterol/gamma-HCH transport system permease protein
MKLNEEVDAITTLGLSVQQVLVLPRLFALVVSMPLLVFIGDLIGILGGMIVADSFLGISHATFIERLKTALPPRHFVTGMIKAPVFAAVIAMIGCRRGLATEMNARSVGMSTTATVVESIVLVIILNAVFAVIFAQIGV